MGFNRLRGSSAYLAGPIDRCPDGGKEWREWITPRLHQRGIVVLDPLKKPCDVGLEADDNRGERQAAKAAGDYDTLARIMKTIRAVDLRLVDLAQFIIAKVDVSGHMCGTYEEIFWANRCKRPILTWCSQGKQHMPEWLFGTLPHQMMFSSLEEILGYIDHINTAPDVDTMKRWLFLKQMDLLRVEQLDAA